MHKQFAEALPCYHKALSLNPNCIKALKGLDRLEKLMRGEDPDEVMHSTMDDLDPEDADESMEAQEYMPTS